MKSSLLVGLLFVPLFLWSQCGRVIGYFPDWSTDYLDSVHYSYCSQINIAFANPDSAARFNTDGVDMQSVIDAAHAASCKVYLSIGGGDLGSAQIDIWAYLSSASMRSVCADSLYQYVQRHHYDGVDVDLEWDAVPTQYSNLILALSAKMKAHGLGLTAALPGDYRYPELSDTALAALDEINAMAYDLTGPWAPGSPGPHSPLDWSKSCIRYWLSQSVPAGKLNLGLPFYGYDFSTSPVSTVSYSEMVHQDGALAYTDQDGMSWYNGIPTILEKTHFAADSAGGVMIWDLSTDYFGNPESLSLLYQIYHACDAIGWNELDSHEEILTKALKEGTVELSLYSVDGKKMGIRRITEPSDWIAIQQEVPAAFIASFNYAGSTYILRRTIAPQY